MRTILMLCLFGVVLCSSNLAQAVNWQVIYSEDFSSDPGWSTNAPSNYEWDQANEQYDIRNIKGTDQSAYIPITYSPDKSYKLTFDILSTRCDWAGYSFFGFWDADMSIYSPTQWFASYHYVDAGKTASLIYWDTQGGYYHPGQAQPIPYSLGTLYHNEAVYDRTAGTLSLTVTDATGTYPPQTLTGVGTFSGIERLGFSNMGDYYAVGSTWEGYIDNVVVYETPEPATLFLLTLGGLAVLRKKK